MWKSTTWKALTLGALIPLALAAPALADDRPGPRMMFEEFDLDGNGAVTLEELQSHGATRFAQADANGDGLLDRDEMLARAQARAETGIDRMIERADADGDGLLSQDEIAEARDGRRGPNPERMFGRMDANDDGQLTEDEFQAAAERFMERRG